MVRLPQPNSSPVPICLSFLTKPNGACYWAGFPAGYAYTCNATAYFKKHEGDVMLAGINRSLRDESLQPELDESLLVVDDYSSHKTDEFRGKRPPKMRQATVKGGMSCYCNPGDVILNRIVQQRAKNKYVTPMGPHPNGTPPQWDPTTVGPHHCGTQSLWDPIPVGPHPCGTPPLWDPTP